MNFYRNDIKVPHVAQKDFLVIKTKIKKNRKRKIGKTTKIGLTYVQFYKTKLHRGRERQCVYNLSKLTCYINLFLTKRRLKDPKMKKLLEKTKN